MTYQNGPQGEGALRDKKVMPWNARKTLKHTSHCAAIFMHCGVWSSTSLFQRKGRRHRHAALNSAIPIWDAAFSVGPRETSPSARCASSPLANLKACSPKRKICSTRRMDAFVNFERPFASQLAFRPFRRRSRPKHCENSSYCYPQPQRTTHDDDGSGKWHYG